MRGIRLKWLTDLLRRTVVIYCEVASDSAGHFAKRSLQERRDA